MRSFFWTGAPGRSRLPAAAAVSHAPASDWPEAGEVAFEGVGKTYQAASGSVRALDDVSLRIPAGRIFGIIGRSGAGKSSLLRTINRLEQPTEGRVRVGGLDVGALDAEQLLALRRRIGMIFQHFNLLSAKTVHENVALPLRVAGVAASELNPRVEEALALVGLQDKRHSYPTRLSGGQKQRVGIARALVSKPQILLCDEATSALDPETTQSILGLLRDINRRLGLTIVLITHEMSVIREICDEVLVLEQGRMAEAGPVWRVFGQPTHDATRALLRPLAHALPQELAARLQAVRPAGRFERLLQLEFNGSQARDPDLAQLMAQLGAGTRLLQADVDRIQGHVQGRLLLAVTGHDAPVSGLVDSGSCHAVKELGYVSLDH